MALTRLNKRDTKRLAKAAWDYAINHPSARKVNAATYEIELNMLDIIMHGAKLAKTKISKDNREQIFDYLVNNSIMRAVDFIDEDNKQVIRISSNFDGFSSAPRKTEDHIAHRKEEAERILHQKLPPAVVVQHEEPEPAAGQWPNRTFNMPAEDIELLLFLQEYGCVEDKDSVYRVIEPMLPLQGSLSPKFNRLDTAGLINRLINGRRTQMVEISDQGRKFLQTDNLPTQINTFDAVWVLLSAFGKSKMERSNGDSSVTGRLAAMLQCGTNTVFRALDDLEHEKVVYVERTEGNYARSVRLREPSPYVRANALFTKFLDVAPKEQPQVTPPVATQPAVQPATEAAPLSVDDVKNFIDTLYHQAHAPSEAETHAQGKLESIADVLKRVQDGNINLLSALGEIEGILQG